VISLYRESEVMDRYKMEDLKKWKNSTNRKPLIIRGARQVGKTWLMQEFGRKYYEKYAYINFDDNTRMNSLFNEDFNIEKIIQGLKIL
jgi:predicted AAA+ superfamily ATPase